LNRSRRLACAALGLAAAGLVGLAPARSARAADPVPTITWGDCSGMSAAAGAECGFISVPLDWDHPNGKKISLAVSRSKATAVKRLGVMLVNPGGPGGSGLGLTAVRELVPNDAGKAYDWIGFDPRGVGASQPSISCDPEFIKGPRPDYTPDSHGEKLSREEDAWLALSKRYAGACAAKYPDLLAHMKTVDTVRDMDAIRRALGESKINYYGFSYGTYLGETYATMFPGNVGRMVLDGIVDPRGVWYSAQLNQDRAFEVVVKRFFAWVARNDATYNLGTTEAAVREHYTTALHSLSGTPIDGIGSSEWVDLFAHTMYAEFLWPATADAFASYVNRHDIAAAKVDYQGTLDPNDNAFAVYNAVQCTDATWPQSYSKTWRPDGFRTAAKAPFMTWSNVWYNTACLYWPAKPGTPIKVDGSKAPPVLLINATLDGATPFSDAIEVRRLFPGARLIAEQDATSHANSLGGNTCITDRIAKYLTDGELPARKPGPGPDVVCKRQPEPRAGFPGYQAGPASVGSNSDNAPAPGPAPPVDPSVLNSLLRLLPLEGVSRGRP